MTEKKIPVIALLGPTAVGKTNLSIEIAKKFNCEIISVDSVQVFKQFDIGSAKITKQEMKGVVHHLIDELEPCEKISVYDFQRKAREKILTIHKKGKIPLLVGGTGYYMSAVIYNYNFSNYKVDLQNLSLNYMTNYLKEKYPDVYNDIDLANSRRIINAYKYVIEEKKSTLENRKADTLHPTYNPYIIVLNKEREKLYQAINTRVEIMINEGLLEEVESILKKYGENPQALSSIGYKEVVSYLKKETSEEKMINDIKQNSRRYAKRQITWFKNKMKESVWYNLDNDKKDDIYKDVSDFLKRGNYAINSDNEIK